MSSNMTTVVALAHQLNARSAQAVADQRQAMWRRIVSGEESSGGRIEGMAAQGEGDIAAMEQTAIGAYGDVWGREIGRRADESQTMTETERMRGADTFERMIASRRSAELTPGSVAGTIEGIREASTRESRLGTSRRRDLNWLNQVASTTVESVVAATRRYNQAISITGGLRIPLSTVEIARMLKDQYDRLRTDLRQAMQISAVGGWKIQDVHPFMLALDQQCALYPSLAAELDATTASLSKNLPQLGSERLVHLSGDVRRAAFLLSEATDAVARDTGELARMTHRSGDEVLGAFMSIRNIAASSHDPVASVSVLRKFFTDLVRDGQRYGIGLEESSYLTQKYASQIQRGLITTGELIRYATGLHQAQPGDKALLAFNIADEMKGRPEYRKALSYLTPVTDSGDTLAASRIMDVISTGSKVVGQQEFHIPPGDMPEVNKELVAMVHEHMRGVVNANTIPDIHLRNEIESVLLDSVGMGETGTSDQRERARTFRLGFVAAPIDQAEKDLIDSEMLAQENAFTRFSGRINHRILDLADRVEQFIGGYKLPDLKTAMTNLKDGIAQIPGKAATAYATALSHVPRNVQEGINQYLPAVKEYAAKYNVDPIFILSQIWKESTFNPQASSGKAYGLTQFTPDTAVGELRQMGVKYEGDLIEFLYKNPKLMIEMQAKRDRDMYDEFKKIAPWADEEELWNMVLSGYNHGFPGTIGIVKGYGKDWKSHIPSETQEYILWIRKHMGEVQGMLQPKPATSQPPTSTPVTSDKIPRQTDDEWERVDREMSKKKGIYPKIPGQSQADTYRVTVSANSPDEAYHQVLGAFVQNGKRGLVEMGARRIG